MSHLILVHTAPASYEDFMLYMQEWGKRKAPHKDKLNALKMSTRYAEGDRETIADYYRIYFSATIKKPEHLSRVNLSLTSFTKEGVLRAREIENQLVSRTWFSSEFDLLPKLKQFSKPTLIIHSDYEFVPVEVAAHIAQAIPGAHFVLLKDCGHFSYIESPEEFHKAITDFFDDT
jgi:proline iminopeptidase